MIGGGISIDIGLGFGMKKAILEVVTALPLLTSLGDGSTFSGGGQTVEQYDGSLVTVDADISAHSGMRWTGTAFVNDDGSGYLCHPVDSNGLSLTYDERVDSTPYAIGDKAYSGRFALTCTADGTSHTSAPTITSTDLGSTVVDGGVTWSVDSWYQVSRGYLGEEARTNKCTCHKANPTNVAGISKAGDAAATLTVVNDAVALAAAGLDKVCSSGNAYQLDNSGGSASAYAILPGEVGNLNLHTGRMFCRASAGTGTLYISSLVGRPVFSSAAYTEEGVERIPASTAERLSIEAAAGAVVYFILPQLEEGAFSTSPIYATPETLAAVTRPKTVASLPTANVLPVNNFGARIAVEPLAAGLTGWALSSYTDADNELGVLIEPTAVTLRKRIGGVDYDAAVSYTHAADTQMEVDLYLTTSEMGCRVREIGGAWSLWTTTANGADAVIADTYQIGSRNDLVHLNGHFRDVQIYKTSDPKSKLESI